MATENQSEAWENSQVRKYFDEALAKVTEVLTAEYNNGCKSKIATLDSQITQVKEQVSTFEPKLTALESSVQDLAKEKDSLIDKVDRMENQRRRNNIRITNLPEDVEFAERDPIKFFMDWIPSVLGHDHFPNPLEIEEVYRTYSPVGNQPRNIIIRLSKYQDRDKILRIAANKWRETSQAVTYERQPVKFFPDLTARLVKRRKEYNEVKRELQTKNLQYSLLYPMTLRVTLHNGEKKFFKTPEEAASFLQGYSGGNES